MFVAFALLFSSANVGELTNKELAIKQDPTPIESLRMLKSFYFPLITTPYKNKMYNVTLTIRLQYNYKNV